MTIHQELCIERRNEWGALSVDVFENNCKSSAVSVFGQEVILGPLKAWVSSYPSLNNTCIEARDSSTLNQKIRKN